MSRAIALLFLLAGCSSSATDVVAAPADLVQLVTDGGSPEVDQARALVDGSSPPDQAQAPADLTPACGGEGQPCCSAQLCGGQANGTLCSSGSCASGPGATAACWMVAGAATCEPCGGVGQLCCGGVSTCHPGLICAGTSSANFNHCD